jgi:hypothetical protein
LRKNCANTRDRPLYVGDPIYAFASNPQVGTANVKNPGTGGIYQVNDLLTLVGGTGTPATLGVTNVAQGEITRVIIASAGSYTTPPPLNACPVTGGHGVGATFNLTMSTPLQDINVDGRAWSQV